MSEEQPPLICTNPQCYRSGQQSAPEVIRKVAVTILRCAACDSSKLVTPEQWAIKKEQKSAKLKLRAEQRKAAKDAKRGQGFFEDMGDLAQVEEQ